MITSDWLCGQIAFIYAFNKVRPHRKQFAAMPLSPQPQLCRNIFVLQVKPAQIVDKLVEIAVDILVPGRGAGEGNW
jgi:hypothetical protein